MAKPKSDRKAMLIRVPPDVRRFLEQRAKEEGVTMLARLIQCVRTEMTRTEKRSDRKAA